MGVVQTIVTFHFSRGGGVYSYLDMTSTRTVPTWGGSSTSSQIATCVFLVFLLISTYFVGQQMRAARKERKLTIWLNWPNAITLVSVIWGWATIASVVFKTTKLQQLNNLLEEL